VTRRGNTSARKINRAQILLKATEGGSDAQRANAVDTSAITVFRTRKRLVEDGLLEALNERLRLRQPRKLDAKQEAHVNAVALSP